MSNVFSFAGTCARDAEKRFLPSGAAVLIVSVANNVGYGDKQKTNWVRVTVWGKRAEGQLGDFLKKGQQVFCSGELTLNEYQAQDGTTKSNLELNASIVDLIGKRNEQGQKSQPAAQQSTSAPANYDDMDDDIPF